MSRTDKTRPYWVKLLDESSARMEQHYHEDGTCNFDEAVKDLQNVWPRKCGYTVSYYGWNSGFFSRGPASWLKAEVRIRHGAARAKLRKDVHDMLKLSREEMEDYDIVNPRPRNGALWDYH
jgi:hypothetical protein